MEYKDYYKTLGVEKTTTKDELKKQYRKLARKFHPDVNTTDKDAATRFGEISEAYNVLVDDEKRRKYDELGADWENERATGREDGFDWSKYATKQRGGETGSPPDDFFGSGQDASDFFRTIFGEGFRDRNGRPFPRRGQDLEAELDLSLKDAYDGGSQVLTVGPHKIRIKLHPGIWDRQRIRITGKGLPGSNEGEAGDLYITFKLRPDADYRLDGIDLYQESRLSVYTAALGGALAVQTLAGKFELTIPAGTANGMVFKLKGRGFPAYFKQGTHGNLFVKMNLELPDKLTEEERRLFKELAALRQARTAGGSE